MTGDRSGVRGHIVSPSAAAPSAVALATVALITGASAFAAPFEVGAVRIDAPVVSMKEQRDAAVVRQNRDYSCGAAALATLLTHGMGDVVSEATLLRALFENISAERLSVLQERGLSLLDLQRLATDRGHRAQGFRVAVDQLSRLAQPVIVLIRPGGYEHFAVLKGVRDGRAYLADPSLGNVRMPLFRFVDQWADASGRGIIFVAERADGQWPSRHALQVDAAPAPARVDRLVDHMHQTQPANLHP